MQKHRVTVYIDGFNLYFGIRDKYGRKFLWLNLLTLSRELLRPHQELTCVKYFTSRVSDTPTDRHKSKRQSVYLEALETLPNLRLYYGHYLQHKTDCRRCNNSWHVNTEKMTDVNIACELLSDVFLDSFDMALLVSGDSDLCTPLDVVRDLFPEKRIIVAFPPRRKSTDLSKRAFSSFTIGRAVLKKNQFPDEVEKRPGLLLHRPVSWV